MRRMAQDLAAGYGILLRVDKNSNPTIDVCIGVRGNCVGEYKLETRKMPMDRGASQPALTALHLHLAQVQV